jgi:mannose-6-phosphate isomerase-like protein (cupin superfamily)
MNDERIVQKIVKIAADNSLKGFVTDIEHDTVENKNFRKVLYTGKYSQLVLMSLNPNEEIGSEVHEETDQFFRIDEGSGKFVINGIEHEIKNGSAIVVPAGAQHNVIADANGLKIYSIYSPPHHADGTIHTTKADADVAEEEFDGQTTEE